MLYLPFDHPFPAFPVGSLGTAWVLPGFSRLAPTSFPSFPYEAWGRVGVAWPFPPVTHSYPTLAILLQWFENS